jgi:aminomethyltransferase
MVNFAGWEMPIQYSSITQEHQAVRQAAGLFDISHMGRLVLEGPDALSLIQRLYTNDAASLTEGQIRYGLVCNEQGGIRDDVLVYRFPGFWLMVVNASNRDKILDWVGRHRTGYDVQITDRTFDWGMVAVQGPRALDLITSCEGPTVKPLFKEGQRLQYYYGRLEHSGSSLVIVSRTGYTGEDGVEVIMPARGLLALSTELEQTATRHRIELTPCGLGARDTLRLEAAMPLYGHELTEDIDPFQAGLGWAVKMDKGDFIGRDALVRRHQDSTRRQRVGLEMLASRIAREGAAVLLNGREVGLVTSGTYTPTLGRAIAMAYVAPELAHPGSLCEVDVRGKPASARVVRLPFYRRK